MGMFSPSLFIWLGNPKGDEVLGVRELFGRRVKQSNYKLFAKFFHFAAIVVAKLAEFLSRDFNEVGVLAIFVGSVVDISLVGRYGSFESCELGGVIYSPLLLDFKRNDLE